MSAGVCPTPWKLSYSSPAAAKEDARRRNDRGRSTPRLGQLTTYACPSGDHWHLTHQAAADRKRVKRRLRKSRG